MPIFKRDNIIDVSSSIEGFRVTQRGNGNALLIEDTTNPDSTPFVVKNNGRVGIGATDPSFNLQVGDYDESGFKLGIVGTGSSFTEINFSRSGSVGTSEIDSYRGVIGYSHLSESLYFFQGGSRVLTVSGSQNVGIGTTTPSAKLEINTINANNTSDPILMLEQLSASTGTGSLKFFTRLGAGDYNNIVQAGDKAIIFSDDSGNGGENFVIAPHATGPSGIRIQQDGNIGIGVATATARLTVSGNVHISGSNNITFATSGQGIVFGGNSLGGTPNITGNSLNDYEEGTWTPVIEGSSTIGVGTYSIQKGRYIKIGNMVYIEASIAWSSHSGAGTMRLGGLPFVRPGTTFGSPAFFIHGFGSITTSASSFITGRITDTTSFITLYQTTPDALGGTNNTITLDTTGGFVFCTSYSTV